MTAAESPVFVRSELSPGEQIEVLRDGTVLHRGTVSATVLALDLLWILDEYTCGHKPDPDALARAGI
jgi:hypothetical protein